VSLSRRRLVATLVVLWGVALATPAVLATSLPNSTWVAVKPLPHQGRVAVFALAVDPANKEVVLAGNSAGAILRSTDGGTTWSTVHAGGGVLDTIAFSPVKAALVLAGTRGGGALVSDDGGQTWSAAAGLEKRSVRAFGFAVNRTFAGTDHGVYASKDATTWTPSGLGNRSIDSIAVLAIHDPVRLVAASDTVSTSGVQLYQSVDAGANWTTFTPPISGTFAVRLVAGPLPSKGNVRPLLAGTNAGLFQSLDNGVNFTPLSGGSLLPTTDYTQVVFITSHHDRFYAASDGGGSGSGGLWRTDNAGATFRSMQPPSASVTALAVSNDEQPVLYIATFSSPDHAAELWAFHDTGNTPKGPPVSPSPFVSGARTGNSETGGKLFNFLSASQLPYVGLGLGALAVMLTALVSQLRSRRR
jgi:hypothetical protein